jgi:hypothetical protein
MVDQRADRRNESGNLTLGPIHQGRATVTARVGDRSASAVLTVLEGERLPAGTIEWSLERTPGFETLLAQPSAAATGSFVDLCSIEWKKASPAIVADISELWRTAFVGSPRLRWVPRP